MDDVVQQPNKPARWRLSRAQQSLWITAQLAPDSGAYNMSIAYEVVGALDARRLEAALDEVVRRHHLLSCVVDDSGESIYHVTTALPVLLHVASMDATAARTSATAAFASRPFDLRRELPLRAALFSSGPTDHVFILCVHHLVADAWSLDLLTQELTGSYAGTLSPPDRVRQFAEFVAAEDQAGTGQRLAVGRRYWLAQLQGAPQVLELPAPLARPEIKDFTGRTFASTLPSTDVDDLRAFCRAGRRTPSSLLLACYAALLYCRTRSPDFLVGVPMPGRTAEDSEYCVGLFANLVPLRVRPTCEMPFQGLLDQTWSATLEAMDWQDYPFISIIRDLEPARSLSRTPVVQTIFNYVRPGAPLRIDGAEIQRLDVGTSYSKYDLALQFIDDGASIRCMLVYDTALFDDQFVGDFYSDLLALLRTAISAPHTSLHELSSPTIR